MASTFFVQVCAWLARPVGSPRIMAAAVALGNHAPLLRQRL